MKIDNDPVSSFYFSSFPSSPEKKSSLETVVKVNCHLILTKLFRLHFTFKYFLSLNFKCSVCHRQVMNAFLFSVYQQILAIIYIGQIIIFRYLPQCLHATTEVFP